MNHSEALPLSSYDEMSLNSVHNEIRALDEDALKSLLDHERAHGNRPAYLETLRHRLEQLENGAQPTSGSPEGHTGSTRGARGGPPVTPATAAQPQTPMRHGMADQTKDKNTP